VLECVVNVSEGARLDVVAELVRTCGPDLLDAHSDPHHNRSVLTLVGEDAPRRLTRAAVELIDLRDHVGVHPRLGVVDVVPYVPLFGATLADAIRARDAFMAWAAAELELPCFHYGPDRTLPSVRRRAWSELAPDVGPAQPHPTAGAVCAGARGVLVAYNVWLRDADADLARRVAATIRGPQLRALGLAVGDRAQVSMNLIEPAELGPGEAFDRVAALAPVAGAELVGLVPEGVLRAVDEDRWQALDLAPDRTIEARLAQRA